MELRLNAPLGEHIRLDFNPFKISDVSGHEPSWKDWHCYRKPLRVYSPDFDVLVSYFNKVYPIIAPIGSDIPDKKEYKKAFFLSPVA